MSLSKQTKTILWTLLFVVYGVLWIAATVYMTLQGNWLYVSLAVAFIVLQAYRWAYISRHTGRKS